MSKINKEYYVKSMIYKSSVQLSKTDIFIWLPCDVIGSTLNELQR